MKQTKLPFVAEVAKTLDSVPAIHPICGQIGYRIRVAEVAKTLDSVPAMHPISGQIGYGLRDEVVEDVAVDVGQTSVDAIRTIRQLGVINP